MTGGNRILYVDDEPQLREVCKEALSEAGYEVLLAQNGQDALAVLKNEAVDLIVTDLKMPRLDGMGLLREIRALGLDPDIIFLTGYGTIENAVECLKKGASDYLLKPFDLRSLLEKIQKVLQERKATRQKNASALTLETVFDFNETLRSQEDRSSVLRTLLGHVKNTFAPSSLALFAPNGGQPLAAKLTWGAFFKDQPQRIEWFSAFSSSLASKGCAKLLDHKTMQHGGLAEKPFPFDPASWSVMVAPLTGRNGHSGALALARSPKAPRYTSGELKLLTLICSQTGTALEDQRQARHLRERNLEVIMSYVDAVEARDVYTRGHSERVSRYAVMLGKALGLPERQVEQLRIAGLLHDIGKIGIPDGILNKAAGLDKDEFGVMKNHPVIGRKILSRIHFLKDILPIVYHHHEWMNGTGYPDGLKGESIPYLARVLSIVDGYEAMTSDRAYHDARSKEEALAILREGANVQWDAGILDVWDTLAASI